MGDVREDFVKKMKTSMDHWNDDIDLLQSSAIRAGSSVRVEMEKNIEDLRNKRKDFQDKLGRLGRATQEAWGPLQTGVESAWKTLDDSILGAKTKYKK